MSAQAVRYPTDLGLLNESREITEKLIDELAQKSGAKKPRTYREQARKRYLNLAKNKKPGRPVAQARNQATVTVCQEKLVTPGAFAGYV